MKSTVAVFACLALALVGGRARADGPVACLRFHRLEARLHGSILDFTDNHGADRRIYSNALQQKRALYVYLPPGFDPAHCYPALIWFHGFRQDEHEFIKDVALPIDAAIARGTLPPLIVAAPDGTLGGRTNVLRGNSFFINSRAGRFEDYVLCDIWPFLLKNFPVRPERQAHVLGGVSMGGFAAYNLAIKHQDQFGAAMSIFPPLNLRWIDCHGRYNRNFDPGCWGWRESVDNGREVIGNFAFGLVRIRLRRMIEPLYGRWPDAIEHLSRENPTEMILRGEVAPGALAMWVGYGGRDEFNLDAQIESFLYVARTHGLDVSVWYDRRGHHDPATAHRMVPSMLCWLAQQIAPFSPGCAASPTSAVSPPSPAPPPLLNPE